MRCLSTAAALLVVTAGCTGSDSPPTAPHRAPDLAIHDSLGVVIEFQQVTDATVTTDSSLIVLDGLAGHVLRFHPSGSVDTIGRRGNGPGELNGPVDVAVGPAGEIAVADVLTGRVTVWRSDARLLGSGMLGGAAPRRVDWLGSELVAKVVTLAPGGPVIELVRIEVDTGGPANAGAFRVSRYATVADSTTCEWCAMAGAGSLGVLMAAPDTFYRITRVGRDASAERRWHRHDEPAVTFNDADEERLRRDLVRLSDGRIPDLGDVKLPGFKLRFANKGLGMDRDGRVWALRNQPDPLRTLIDVFTPDGEFMGAAAVDRRLTGIDVRGDRLVGIGESEEGTPMVYLYRIVDSAGGLDAAL